MNKAIQYQKNIVSLSLPYLAGIALGSAFPAGDWEWTCALLSSAGCALLLVVLLMWRRSDAASLPLFLLLGLLSWTSWSLSPALPSGRESSGAVLALCSEIDSLELESERCTELLKALLSGNKAGLDRELREAFRSSGASHILALSGLHLGILYGILSSLLSLLGRSRGATLARSLCCIAAAFLYARATGFSSSIVRALLYIIFNEICTLSPERKRHPANILCASLLIQLCLRPGAIRELGFQLSYLAMLGIGLVFPRLEEWYPAGRARFNPMRKLWSTMALSISCQLTTAPLVLLRFGTFPRYFLLTNLLSLPLVEAFIWCGVAALALNAVGIGCPAILKSLTETVGEALIYCIELIASL